MSQPIQAVIGRFLKSDNDKQIYEKLNIRKAPELLPTMSPPAEISRQARTRTGERCVVPRNLTWTGASWNITNAEQMKFFDKVALDLTH